MRDDRGNQIDEEPRVRPFSEARRDRRIPEGVQFACVVGTGTRGGDGLVARESQWPEDLQRQGIPAVALDVLRPVLPPEFKPVHVACTVQSIHADRFVTRICLLSGTGEERAYALKVYSDDFVERVWTHSQALARHHQPKKSGLCLASRYIPGERLLVFPWVSDWDLNYFSSIPFIDPIVWASPYFRGAISGLGVIRVWTTNGKLATYCFSDQSGLPSARFPKFVIHGGIL